VVDEAAGGLEGEPVWVGVVGERAGEVGWEPLRGDANLERRRA
jgi:hypothetical protein